MKTNNEQLIKQMKDARYSHIVWAKHQEYLRRNKRKSVKHVGSSTFHRRWVKIYDNVIKELEQ